MGEHAHSSALHRTVWQTLSDGVPVVVTTHARLDGDGAGSVLALWHGLKVRGLDARPLFQRPIPSVFGFLPGMGDSCAGAGQLPPAYHLAVLDCGTFERLGDLGQALSGRVRMVNIDHHTGNSQFGDVNWVEPAASSCGEMVTALLAAGGVALTPQIAECILAAIMSDTGQLSHEDTTPEAFAACGECVRAGARPHEVVRRLFCSPSPAQVKLQQLALASLRFYCEGRLATMDISRRMLEATDLQPADTEGFAELPISIQGVEVSALLKEMPGCDYIKVSMRSRQSLDVCAVARAMGGGGHVHAAGCEVRGSLAGARRIVVGRLTRLVRDGGA